MTRLLTHLFLPLALLLAALPARAVNLEDLLPVEEAYRVEVVAESRERIALRIAIADGYYLYRHRMGASAPATEFTVDSLELPEGIAYTDEFFGDVETYRERLDAAVLGRAAAGASRVALSVRYQGCADVGVCYPPHQQIVHVSLPAAAALPAPPSLPLGGLARPTIPGLLDGPIGEPVEALPLPEEEAFDFDAIALSGNELLLRFTPAPGYYVYQDRSAFRIVEGDGVGLGAPRWPEGTPHADEHFGEVLVYFNQFELPMSVGRRSGEAQRIVLEATFQGCQNDGVCYPPMTRRVAIDLPAGEAIAIEETPPALAGASLSFLALLAALGGALIGGLILNLMPCVLPILSLKALGLASSGESREKARAHALWYTAGVLATFAAVGLGVIALRAAGEALGWGFQLQQPIFVALLVYVMLAIGLSLSGVFTLGAGVAGLGQNLTQKSGPAGDFFTGVLAVVVASPCTAPFMGTALAFAFAAPTALALAVFLALGLGLALPFLLIGFVPAFARMLPRPGAWMDGFKQAMAFPMYLTAVWLIWVLGKQRGIDAVGLLLIGAVLLAAALWWLERLRHQLRPVARVLAVALLLLALLPLWGVGRIEAPVAATGDGVAADGSVAYSAERLDALRADGRAVFINMTADWCVTCKANERRVLAGEAFRAALTLTDTVYMKGDWTNVDPAITAFLQVHGAVGVPLYVVYPPNGGSPRVLPLVLSEAMVLEALGVSP
jgi:thiol:disulfide interchange protein